MEKAEEEKNQQEPIPLECTEDGVCRVRAKSRDDAEEESSSSSPTTTDANKSTLDDNGIDGTGSDNKSQEAKNPKPNKNALTATSHGAVRTLHSQADLNALLASSSSSDDTTVIVEFITTWCGACKSIATQWQDLAAENDENIVCATVVCDKNKTTQKLAAEYGVKSYPVFIVWHQGQQVQKWNGADIGKLVKVFEKYGTGGGSKKGKGRGTGGGGKKKGRR